MLNCNNKKIISFTEKTLQTNILDKDLKEISFKEVLEKYKGKTVMIDVWASWCPDCVGGLPKVKEIQKKYPNVTYLFISVDKTPDSWKKGIEKYGVDGEHYFVNDGMKGVFGSSIKLDWIPRYMVISKEGSVDLYKATDANDTRIEETIKINETVEK